MKKVYRKEISMLLQARGGGSYLFAIIESMYKNKRIRYPVFCYHTRFRKGE